MILITDISRSKNISKSNNRNKSGIIYYLLRIAHKIVVGESREKMERVSPGYMLERREILKRILRKRL
jgi:hypothetical protein